MENTAAFLISIGLICFGLVLFATAKFGSSPVLLIFALIPFAVGVLSVYGQFQSR